MPAARVAAGVTVLMTSELEDRYTDLRFSPYGTAFMTDAIVVQRYMEVDSRLRRVPCPVQAPTTLDKAPSRGREASCYHALDRRFLDVEY